MIDVSAIDETTDLETLLVEIIQGSGVDGDTGFTYDPLGFVMYVYPWGVEGTPLAKYDAPDTWQIEVLEHIRESYEAGLSLKEAAKGAIRVAVASGHGIGKTALVAWIIHWFMSVFDNPQVVVTANTKTQLTTKTWRELAKWHKMSVHEHWFDWAATTFKLKESPETWCANAIPWSEHNSEAFAGTHDENVLMIFDEASAIADCIWQVAEGAMTTGNCVWIAFGNPTKNTGAFAQCFKRFRHRWFTKRVDSRTAKMADQKLISEWVEDYGEDSDFVRVRVRGMNPRSGDQQLISVDRVENAVQREAIVPNGTPRIMGVDVARYGSDMSVIARRHGRKLEPLSKYRGLDTMELAAVVAHAIVTERPDMVMVDGTGIGAGVIDRLRQLGHDPLEIHFGQKPDPGNDGIYFNKRIEMWNRMNVWLQTADIPRDPELYDDLITPEYYFDMKMKMRLESKEEMKKRGMQSPDCFIAGTMITTPKGFVPIEQIACGMKITTPYGDRTVFATQVDYVDSVATFDFANGRSLSGKGKHRVFTWDSGFVRLDALSLTNEIETDSLWSLVKWQIMNLLHTGEKNTGFKRQVDIISQGTRLRKIDFYTEEFISITSARSRLATMFTTVILIGRITIQRTYSHYLKASTGDYIKKNGSKTLSILHKIKNILKPLRKLQRSGIDHRKDLNGTQSTASEYGKAEILLMRLARYVLKDIKPSTQIVADSVLMPVSNERVILGTRQQPDLVQTAGKHSPIINTESKNVARASAPIDYALSEKKIPVYNLTLDKDNVYYANGILVENCGDAVALTFAYIAPPIMDYNQDMLEPEYAEDM